MNDMTSAKAKSSDGSNEASGHDVPSIKQLSKRSLSQAERRHAEFYYDFLKQRTKTYEAAAEHAALNALYDFDTEWTLNRDDYEEATRKALEALRAFKIEWGQIVKAQIWAVQHAKPSSEAQEPQTKVAWELCSRFPAVGASLLAIHQAPTERIEWSRAALSAADHLGDKSLECIHFNHLGLAYTESGNYKTAREYYQRVIATAQVYPETRRYASKAYINRALTCARTGEYDTGIDDCNTAITVINSIVKTDNDLLDIRRDEVKAQNILGELYSSQRKIAKAIEHCNKALKLAQKIHDFRGQANALGSLGNIYLKPSSWPYHNLDNAIHHYEQALAIYVQHGDQAGMITGLTMLIDAFRRQRRFDEALKHSHDAFEVAKTLNSLYHLAGLHYYTALVYKDRGEREKALHHAREACKYFEMIGMRQMIEVACSLKEQLS